MKLHLAIVPILAVLVAAYVLFPRATPRPAEKEACASQPACGYLPSLRTGAPSERSGLKSEVPDAAVPVPVLTGGGAPTPRPSGEIGEPASYFKPTPKPRIVGGISGTSSWYDYVPGGAAAGPRLRAFLGPHWRGTIVRVCAGSACVVAQLSDWCGCNTGAEKLIDLDDRLFAALAPLSRGVVGVTVTVVE